VTRMSGGVTGTAREGLPMSIIEFNPKWFHAINLRR